MAQTEGGFSGLALPASERIAETGYYGEQKRRRNRQDQEQRDREQQEREREQQNQRNRSAHGHEEPGHTRQGAGPAQAPQRPRRGLRADRSILSELLFVEVSDDDGREEPPKRRRTPGLRSRLRRQGQAPETPAGEASRTDSLPVAARNAVPPRHLGVPPDLIEVPSDLNVPDTRLGWTSDDTGAWLHASEQVMEAHRVACQLRFCLSQHTETARKVSAYLRALLANNTGSYRPRLVIEI